MKYVALITLMIIGIIGFIGCSKSDSGGGGTTAGFCDGVSSKYASDVQPLLTTHCLLGSPCHGAGSMNAGGELTDYTKVFNMRARIKAAVNAGTMPQNSSLTLDQKKKIICWIDGGAPNN